MSEFYFDYKCISMGNNNYGTERQDQALDFYLFQNKGNLCIQVYVPEALQNKEGEGNCCGAKVFFSPDGVDFPSEFPPKDSLQQASFSGSYLREKNHILIENTNTLSGSGMIVFLYGKEGEAPIREENAYRFFVNWGRKEMISYRITKPAKNRICVQVLYPHLRQPLSLKVVGKEGAKPIFGVDAMRKGAKVGEILLPVKNRALNAISPRTIKVERAAQEYRLFFENPEDGRHFLLVDESDPDEINAKKPPVSKRKADKKPSKKENKVLIKPVGRAVKRCPYCGREMGGERHLADRYIKGTTQIIGCDGNVIYDSRDPRDVKSVHDNFRGKQTWVCVDNLREQYIKATNSDKYADHLILPDNYMQRPAMNVTVVGLPDSGKTIFLASLMNVREVTDVGQDYGAHPTVLDQILKCFDCGKRVAEEVNVPSGLGKTGVGAETRIDLSKAVEPKNVYNYAEDSQGAKLKKRYCLDVGGQVEKHTKAEEETILSWNPMGFTVGDLGFAYFYDVPGEVYNGGKACRAVKMADCLIALIDGNKPKEVAVAALDHALKKLPQMAQKTGEKLADIPIAIVLTKYDKLLEEYADGQEALQQCFDENCHIVREDMSVLFPKNGIYEGSELERHIDCASYEIESFFLSIGNNSGRSILKGIKNTFPKYKFFACSALGSDKRLVEVSKVEKQVLFQPRRLRMELPLAWLMYQQGLIRR